MQGPGTNSYKHNVTHSYLETVWIWGGGLYYLLGLTGVVLHPWLIITDYWGKFFWNTLTSQWPMNLQAFQSDPVWRLAIVSTKRFGVILSLASSSFLTCMPWTMQLNTWGRCSTDFWYSSFFFLSPSFFPPLPLSLLTLCTPCTLQKAGGFFWKLKNLCSSLYCIICFVAIVWNGTLNISKMCLYSGGCA